MSNKSYNHNISKVDVGLFAKCNSKQKFIFYKTATILKPKFVLAESFSHIIIQQFRINKAQPFDIFCTK